MIKNIKKLAAFILVSILLTMMNISFTTYAQTGGTTASDPKTPPASDTKKPDIKVYKPTDVDSGLAKVFDGLTECIPPIPDDATDAQRARLQYIVTVIEEPLDYTRANMDEVYGKKAFISTICFRNTFNYLLKSVDGKTSSESTLVKLATGCSDKATQKEIDYTGPKAEASVGGQDVVVYYSCKQVQVLLSRGGTSLIEGYIAVVYKWGASMVGIIAVLVIVISGIQISASGGDTEAVNQAKTRIIKSISGIALLFLSGLILYTINPTFFVQ